MTRWWRGAATKGSSDDPLGTGGDVTAIAELLVPSRDAILTDEDMMAILRVSREKLHKADFPHFLIGRDRRYVYGQVLDYMTEKAQ